MLIRFTESRWLDTEDRAKGPLFKKGSTHDLNEASAQRWIRRDVAVAVVESPKLKLDRPMMDLAGVGKLAAETGGAPFKKRSVAGFVKQLRTATPKKKPGRKPKSA